MVALQVPPQDTPLQVKLGRVANLIVKLGTFAAVALFLVLFIKFLVQLHSSTLTPSAKGQQFVQILIVSVIILVIAVPEGLPLAVTLSLAYATIRMLRDRNLVRVLQACETMGNATTVCSDKTGTLTQNSMQIAAGTIGVTSKFGGEQDIKSESMPQFFSQLPTDMSELFVEGIVANSTVFEQVDGPQREFIGSRTEAALLEICRNYLGLDDLSSARHNLDIIQEFPFNADRKLMAVVIEKWEDGRRFYRLYVKGASEWLLERCTRFVDVNGAVTIYAMNEDDRANIAHTISDYAAKAFRALGLLYRDERGTP
jgi:Ca2+-transporting ATPase